MTPKGDSLTVYEPARNSAASIITKMVPGTAE